MENNQFSNDIESLIAGFLTNSLNDRELNSLNDWLNENVSHQEQFNRLRSAWILAGHETGKQNYDAQAGWQKIRQSFPPVNPKRKNGLMKYLTPVRYAASLLICFALGTIAATMVLRNQPDKPVAIASITTVKAPMGSKSNVVLPDGSTVWLNAGSTISYATDFGVDNRELQLTGEAFFDVESNPEKPFDVHTPGMTVRALGTRFNVKAYPEENTIATTLEEGIVDILIHASSEASSAQLLQLKPNEQMVAHKKDVEQGTGEQLQFMSNATQSTPATIQQITILSNVETVLSTSWKDTKWIIADEPLAHFVPNLERRYNLNIRFDKDEEELKQYKFSATISTETVEQILTALALTAPVNYKFDKNNDVVLSVNQKNKDKFNKVLRK